MKLNMHPTATATLLLVAAFLGGLISGVVFERAVLGSVPEARAAASESSPRDSDRFDRDRLAEELGLTEAQRTQIDQILDEQQDRIRSIMRETRPRTREVIHETRARVEQILTPEQRARWEEIHPHDDKHGQKR